MHLIDWSIVTVFGLFVIFAGYLTSKLMRSVADFLAAGRFGGRYLLCVSGGIAALGGITIIANLEMNLLAGFSMTWWGMSTGLVWLTLTALGWVIYRFRQTRSLTLAQFFEVRYSRKFRIFAGSIAYLAGIINMGIFPAVEARFFIYFCGLPNHFHILNLAIPTFPVIMLILLGISIYFVFAGGQVAVMITDFIQGTFVNIVFIVIVIFFLFSIPWGHIGQALATAPADASMINPFKTSAMRDFNFWYFFIGLFGGVYCAMSWQGTQAYNVSAKSAHEAKIAGMLGSWRGNPQNLFLLMVPIIAYMVLHHPHYSAVAASVSDAIKGAGSEAVQNQLRVPMVLTHLLPRGLMGMFVAVVFAASITTLDTYLHSWGSILVQDVIMPLRKKPFEPRSHLRALRWSILAVAIFVFGFSLLYKQNQYILMFFAITGAIFAGGSGAVIIGGLYWKRGTSAAAWTAMITGSSIAVGGIVIHQVWPGFPVNGQWIWAIAMVGASLLYILVSLVGKRRVHDMDKMLHRGRYAVPGEGQAGDARPARGWKIFGLGKEFSKFDRILYVVTYAETFLWTIVFFIGTFYSMSHNASDAAWMRFWRGYIIFGLIKSVVVIVWFTFGGLNDLKKMVRSLRTATRDDADDGFIRSGEERQ